MLKGNAHTNTLLSKFKESPLVVESDKAPDVDEGLEKKLMDDGILMVARTALQSRRRGVSEGRR